MKLPSTLIGVACAALAVALPPETPSTTRVMAGVPESDFDFWIGEWSVQNRNLQADGAWKDGDVTRARITPLLDGNALLEEWSGPFHGGFMNGFSLRSWDDEAKRWTIVLCWTSDGNASFGRMRGGFRHGRGEFIAAGPNGRRTRYMFSDALADSVRWDNATSQDSGVTWKTDWIMEFSRTHAAEDMGADRLFATAWQAGNVSPYAEARELDWLVGEWRGHVAAGPGKGREARLRACLLNKDCLIADVLETRAESSEPWEQERLFVRAYVANAKAWRAIGLTSDDPVIRDFKASLKEGAFTFEEARAGDRARVEVLERRGSGALAIRSARPDGSTRNIELSRQEAR